MLFRSAHTHLELTILRGLLENVPFVDWIRRLVKAKYQILTRDALKLSALLGAMEMIRAGVTTIGEVMDLGVGFEAMKEIGLQGVAYQEVFGPDPSSAPEALDMLKSKVDAFQAFTTDSLRIGVSPHAPYTVCEPL